MGLEPDQVRLGIFNSHQSLREGTCESLCQLLVSQTGVGLSAYNVTSLWNGLFPHVFCSFSLSVCNFFVSAPYLFMKLD